MTERSAQRFDHLIQLVLVALLAVGCWLVLRPFFTAILFAIVVAVSTWPAYRWLLRGLRGHRRTASLLGCVMVVLVVILPAYLVVESFTDGAAWLFGYLQERFADGPPLPPAWMQGLPVLGPTLHAYWLELATGPDSFGALLKQLAGPMREFAIASGRVLGIGLFQFVLAVLVLYLLYRDGDRLLAHVRSMAERIGGPFAFELLLKAERSVVGVMVSVIGAGLAQAMVATLGFAIAGVPQPFLLGTLTFVLSLVPWGPVVIWAGAAVWLFRGGEPGWALFMLLYGWLGISSVDNLLKPFLISRSSHLPFALTIMGVVGGVLVFGVMGLFLGPTLLALAINLAAHWLERARAEPPAGSGLPPAT
jgi:predicted PurR-regulated permease PerM